MPIFDPSDLTPFDGDEQPSLIPESPDTLKLQLQQLVDGLRRVVMFPKGTPLMKKPKGMQSVETPEGTFIYDPKVITSAEILAAVDGGRLNEILGAADGGMGPENKGNYILDSLTGVMYNRSMENNTLTYQDFDSREEYLEYIETESELAEEELEPEVM